MKQLTQILKNGKMQVLEVSPPVVAPGMVLVRNHYSLVSAGTEGGTVSSARKSLIGKAREKPHQVRQVIDVLKQHGPIHTYRAVMKRLDAYSPLGYSSAGEVIEAASDVKGFIQGDFVACGGGRYASHAEVIAVPVNLCVKVHKEADLKRAVYSTIGAIAMQGIRQADLKIGESCAVIGLGLIGQLTCLMLRASGIRVAGIDIDINMVKIASRHCVDMALLRDEPGAAEKLDEFTDGIGVDGVIITAAANSSDPVNFAGRILRKKGRVVIVGNVSTDFDREPDYYRKELELRMSCSYGPGRYDINYEEKGIDYPAGYVRWTENRNMKAFYELIRSGKINIDYLTTHIFDIEKAPDAYDLILKREESFLGLLIRYHVDNTELRKKIYIQKKEAVGKINIAFIGAGSYAMNYLLPAIPENTDIVLKGIMTSTGTSSRTAAEKYGFEFCTSDEDDIFNNKDINTVFIATRHNTHAEYAISALRAGKNVFVEKPLCLSEEDLSKIKEAYDTTNEPQPALMAGFNRRFSPLAEIVMEKIGKGPMAMIYRINAMHIPADTWIQDKDIGGGRIIGEVCHFVDFLTFINGSLPDYVFASALPDPSGLEDTININIRFKNGSIGTISYFSNGSKSLFKEYIEVYRLETTAVLKDFRELAIYSPDKTVNKKLITQDKGQKKMVESFIDSIKDGRALPITFEEIYSAAITSFKIIESIRTNMNVSIPLPK